MSSPIYVVVCENDKPRPDLLGEVDVCGAVIPEQYVEFASLEGARHRAAHFERWGACRIARLVFEDEPGFAS